MTENQAPSPATPTGAKDDRSPDREAYNLVTDLWAGPNVRWSDNKFQALIAAASALLGAVVVAVLAGLNPRWELPWYGGALIGSFAGLVVGVFASGIFLMFYRGIRHLLGKHD